MRTAFIGSVNGHADSFRRLLEGLADRHINFVVQVGNLIGGDEGGPDDNECVRLARDFQVGVTKSMGMFSRVPDYFAKEPWTLDLDGKVFSIKGHNEVDYLANPDGRLDAEAVEWIRTRPYHLLMKERGYLALNGGLDKSWWGDIESHGSESTKIRRWDICDADLWRIAGGTVAAVFCACEQGIGGNRVFPTDTAGEIGCYIISDEDDDYLRGESLDYVSVPH